jgi:carbonic anhydrase
VRKDNLIPVLTKSDIPTYYRGTPIELFLKYHNLDEPFVSYQKAQMLIGMCMDHRKHLHIPENFAYIIRSGGANLRYSEFKVSYAIAVGGVQAIALIAHTHCGMVNLISRREAFIQGLMDNAGWKRNRAEEHFMNLAPMYEIDNETDFVAMEALRLRNKYPKVLVAPMLYKVEDNRLYLVRS